MNTSYFVKLFLGSTLLISLIPSFATAIEDGANNDPSPIDFTAVPSIPSNEILESLSNVLSSNDQVTRGNAEVQIFRRWSPAVVLIQSVNGFGAGAIINSSGNIITNWHVINGSPVVKVIFKPQKDAKNNLSTSYASADVVRVDREKDLALLKLNRMPNGIEPIVLNSASEIEVGMDAHAIGHPGGEVWTYTKGFVSQVRPDYSWSIDDVNHEAEIIQIQTPISPGNSGGPLLSSEGKLLGINTLTNTELNSVNYAVSVNEVMALLAIPGDNRPPRSPPKNTVQAQLCNTDVVQEFRNEKRKIHVQLFDRDCDGKIDSKLTVPDSENEPISLSLDGLDADVAKAVLYDENRDGNWDYALFDLDGDKSAELIGYYKDGETEPYKYEKYLKYSYLP